LDFFAGVGGGVPGGPSSSVFAGDFSALVVVAVSAGVAGALGRASARGVRRSTDKLSTSTTAGLGGGVSGAAGTERGAIAVLALTGLETVVGVSDSGWRWSFSARTRNAPEPEAAMQSTTATATENQGGRCPSQGE